MINSQKIPVRKPEEKRPLWRLGFDGMITLKFTLKKYGIKVWTIFVWLSTGIGSGLQCTGQQTSRFHGRRGVSCPTE
jgi:hypothetical protein